MGRIADLEAEVNRLDQELARLRDQKRAAARELETVVKAEAAEAPVAPTQTVSVPSIESAEAFGADGGTGGA